MRRGWLVAGTALLASCGLAGRRLAPIRMQRIATLGAQSGDGVITSDPTVSAPMADGARIVIVGAAGIPSAPMVFSASGHFAGVLAAPDFVATDFQTPLFARVGPGDSLWVFDAAPRVQVFGPDRRYVRTISLPFSPWDAIVLSDSRIVVASSSADRPLPLFRLSATGTVEQAIGDSTTAVRAPRWIARARDGSIWAIASQRAWLLEHWDSNGMPLGPRVEAPAWFDQGAHDAAASASAPAPSIQAFWIDAAGKLWVVGQVADVHWARGLSRIHGESSTVVVQDADRSYDTMLETRDPVSGAVVLSTRLDPDYAMAADPRTLVHVIDTKAGWKVAELVRMQIDSSP